MSKRIEVSAVCPNCDKKYSADVYRTIWGENPSNRKLVFDNLINDVECPDCSHIVKIPIPFLYVDVKKQFAVWYEPEKDPQIDEDIANYNKIFNPGNFYATAPRISDWNEGQRQ
ncbi:hypothetical protein H8E77_04450 [bacterium]|nr:hypothetical protein [bacterium]